MRDYKLYLNDIVDAIAKIERFTHKMSYRKFSKDEKTIDATIRNLEVIGEAAKHVPNKIKVLFPDIEWDAIVGMRNIIAHEYFGVNLEIIWKTVNTKLSELKAQIKKAL